MYEAHYGPTGGHFQADTTSKKKFKGGRVCRGQKKVLIKIYEIKNEMK